MVLQDEYDKIRFWFKTTQTGSPYDDLEWDGKTLYVILKNETIETYSRFDLIDIGII